MNQDSASPMSLLVHDGELGDVRALLEEIGAPFVERRAELAPGDADVDWGLVIASPRRILDLALPSTRAPTRIAVMSQDSRTLRSSLRRAGIQLLVRRPVHPATMRALVVRALYQGAERRHAQRVSIGAPVHYRAGWRLRPAVLVDLSLDGCRLLTDRRLEPGIAFTLHVPEEIAGDRAFAVRGRILQSAPDADAAERRFATTARFDDGSRRVAERLENAVKAHAHGPATCDGAPPLAPAPPDPGPAALPVGRGRPADSERRSAPRRQLDRRVISLSEEATRVLMGRDITIGGMRVNRHPTLRVGTELLLAVHADGHSSPLVLRARVHRDDGERGMVLRFHPLTPEESLYLDDVMNQLPLVDADGDDADGGRVVTEILEAS